MKKLLAALLCVMMVVCFMPTMAFADGEGVECEGDGTCTHVAAIGTTHYDSLQDAVNAVTASGAEKTVTLLRNVEEGSGVIVRSGTNITIDFGGHTYTVTNTLAGSTGYETQCFQLLKNSTIKMTNGIIVANNSAIKMMIQNYSNLTLEGMTIDATKGTNTVGYVLSNNNGNTLITGETQITAKNTGTAFDVYYWPSAGYTDGVSVTLDANMTGKITGNIEYATDSQGSSDVSQKAHLNIVNGTVDGDLSTNIENASIAISGGTFTTEEDISDYIVEGMTKDESGNIIIDMNTAVAEVNGVGYTSLAAAIDAAGPSDTVKLLKDISLDVTLNVNKTIKLDGADGSVNHIISAGEVFQSGQLVNFYGDGSVVKNITFDSANKAKGVQTYAKNVAAALSFENVVIKNSVGSGMTVNGTTTTIKNATFEGNTWQDVNVDSGNGVTNDSKLIIDSGCNFKSAIQIASDGQDGIEPLKYGTIELKDTTKIVTEKMVGTKKVWTMANKPSTGGYYPTTPTTQNPTIEASEGVTVVKGSTGTTATITVADGYELVDVTVNGVSKGKVTTLTGLKTGDKVVVTAQKIAAPDDNAAAIEAVKSVKLVARSQMSKAQGKKAVKITWYASDGSEVKLDGVEIFRSTKRYSGFGTKPIFSTTKAQYHNTAIEVGTKYYYKVRGYKMIGGEKIYTDWSTKAWRTVK